MEKQRSEYLKEFSLAAFVLAGFVLILLIWSNSLSDSEPQGPGFYRAAMVIDEDFYLTMTMVAASGTPAQSRDHKNDHGSATPTLVTIMATSTPTSMPTPVPPTPSIEFEQ